MLVIIILIMQVRNSAIGKYVIDSSRPLPSIEEMNYLPYGYTSLKAGVGKKEVPAIIANKKIVVSPPKTEFKIQDFPLKRMNRGISGWDWQTETREENELTDRAVNCKPKYSTFTKLFPSRNSGLYPVRKSCDDQEIKIENLNKEFYRKVDRISEYREIMLKAQQLFKIQ